MTAVTAHVEGGVLLLTLNRPEKRNAVDAAMREELATQLREADTRSDIRVLVVTGAGTAFCAGSDLKSGDAVLAANAPRSRLVAPFEALAKPIVVAVNGSAVGGGLEIVLCCDVRIAATNAQFGLPEVRVGSLPGSGGTQRLPFSVGPALAAQMILTGEMITAELALKSGLVSELCEPQLLLDRAMAIARMIAANAPLSVLAAKRALRAAEESALGAGLCLETTLFDQLALSEDRAEGRRAFRERRSPNFTGR